MKFDIGDKVRSKYPHSFLLHGNVVGFKNQYVIIRVGPGSNKGFLAFQRDIGRPVLFTVDRIEVDV